MDDAPKKPIPENEIKGDPNINFFGSTNFRNQNRKFGIKTDDRRRHMYVVGKTGMGKTTILENMVLNDIYAGHGVGLVDPHGDFAEKIIDFIPSNRINDVVYFNPSDVNFPIGFNILESINPEYRHLVASGLMGVFKKIWPDVWSARMEYILNNTLLALLDFPGTTLLGINRLLADDDYRRRVVNNLKDPVVKAFWLTEFAGYSDKYKQEAVAPIQNKIGQFLSASVIRNIVAQVKSRIDIRNIMDSQKIFIMNLSKGRIGEDNSRLLGGMLITKIQLAAMERVDIPENTRKDFFLYVDEFQNFATESFANILSEARKYRLDLIMAHQYMEQLDELVLAAVIGNVGTMVTFRVGSTDAEILAKEFAPTFVEEDLVNLPKYQTYLKLMIDGVASRPFSATTLPPIGSSTASTEKIVRVSRERYAVPRESIEDKIMRWSGMIPMSAEDSALLDAEGEDDVKKAAVPEIPAPKSTPPIAPAAPSKPAPVVVAKTIPASIEKSAGVSTTTTTTTTTITAPVAPVQQRAVPTVVASVVVNKSLPQNQSTSAGAPREPGTGRNRNKKNKNKSSGGGNSQNSPRPPSGQNVQLVDSNQKGISLAQAVGGTNKNPLLSKEGQAPQTGRGVVAEKPPAPAPKQESQPSEMDLGFAPPPPRPPDSQPVPASPPVTPKPPVSSTQTLQAGKVVKLD